MFFFGGVFVSSRSSEAHVLGGEDQVPAGGAGPVPRLHAHALGTPGLALATAVALVPGAEDQVLTEPVFVFGAARFWQPEMRGLGGRDDGARFGAGWVWAEIWVTGGTDHLTGRDLFSPKKCEVSPFWGQRKTERKRVDPCRSASRQDLQGSGWDGSPKTDPHGWAGDGLQDLDGGMEKLALSCRWTCTIDEVPRGEATQWHPAAFFLPGIGKDSTWRLIGGREVAYAQLQSFQVQDVMHPGGSLR